MSQQDSERELHKLYHSASKSASQDEDGLAYIRRISNPIAAQMLEQIGLNEGTKAPFLLFDNGCGSGVVAECLQATIKSEVLSQSKILCGDIVRKQVDFVNKMIKDQNWVNTEAMIIDAQNIALDTASFDYITMNMVLHIVPDSEKALAGLRPSKAIRILKPGGTLAFTTGHRDSSGWAAELESAFASLPFKVPFVKRLQTTKWGEWYDVDWIRRTLEDGGLEDVKVRVYSNLFRMESAEYFVRRNMMMIDWVMNTDWSEETRREHGREEVFEFIRQFLDKKYNGRPFDLTGTAIIASGRVPS